MSLDRSRAPEYSVPDHIEIPEAQRFEESDIPIYFIQSSSQPIIRLEVFLDITGWKEQHPGISYFAAKGIKEGTASKPSGEIDDLLAYYGGHLEINLTPDRLSVVIYGLKKHFPELIKIIADCLFNASMPDKEIEALKLQKSQELAVKLEKSGFVASRMFRKTLYSEDHPYGVFFSPEEAMQIKTKDIREFYNREIKNTGIEALFSGDVDNKILSAFDQAFGGWSFNIRKRATESLDSYFEREQRLIKRDKALQSSIRVGKILVNKSHPDYKKILVANEILGGYFGARLMKNIREEKGYTYGIYSTIVPLKNSCYMVIGTDVKREFTQNTLQEIYKEIGILSDTLVSDNELETVRNHMIGSFQSNLNSPFALADKFKGVHFHGLDYSFYSQYFNILKQITSREIREIARQYLAPNSMSQVVIGNIQ